MPLEWLGLHFFRLLGSSSQIAELNAAQSHVLLLRGASANTLAKALAAAIKTKAT